MSADDFRLVSHKKGKKTYKPQIQAHLECLGEPTSQELKDKVIRRISQAKIEISSSDLRDSVVASLREGIAVLKNPKVEEIVCLGLGHISECTISRYQFALLLCLGDHYRSVIRIYDPVFTRFEREVIDHFECDNLDVNLEGKYKSQDEGVTIFYMPHCPKQLSNNLIWANWGLNLTRCVIISNSFQSILDNCADRSISKNAEYIKLINPYVIELAVINTFRFFEVFNDTAIHIFPPDQLRLIPRDFWDMSLEPCYSDSDLEFIKSLD